MKRTLGIKSNYLPVGLKIQIMMVIFNCHPFDPRTNKILCTAMNALHLVLATFNGLIITTFPLNIPIT